LLLYPYMLYFAAYSIAGARLDGGGTLRRRAAAQEVSNECRTHAKF
jgi:hypothetical protein